MPFMSLVGLLIATSVGFSGSQLFARSGHGVLLGLGWPAKDSIVSFHGDPVEDDIFADRFEPLPASGLFLGAGCADSPFAEAFPFDESDGSCQVLDGVFAEYTAIAGCDTGVARFWPGAQSGCSGGLEVQATVDFCVPVSGQLSIEMQCDNPVIPPAGPFGQLEPWASLPLDTCISLNDLGGQSFLFERNSDTQVTLTTFTGLQCTTTATQTLYVDEGPGCRPAFDNYFFTADPCSGRVYFYESENCAAGAGPVACVTP